MSTHKKKKLKKNLLEQNLFKYTSALLKLLRATSQYRQLLKDIGPVQVPVEERWEIPFLSETRVKSAGVSPESGSDQITLLFFWAEYEEVFQRTK